MISLISAWSLDIKASKIVLVGMISGHAVCKCLWTNHKSKVNAAWKIIFQLWLWCYPWHEKCCHNPSVCLAGCSSHMVLHMWIVSRPTFVVPSLSTMYRVKYDKFDWITGMSAARCWPTAAQGSGWHMLIELRLYCCRCSDS